MAKKYVFVYYKDLSVKDETPMEEIHKVWTAWFEELGDNLVDGGNPFNSNGQFVDANETGDIPADMWPSVGYSMVEADSMDEAVKLAQGSPMLKAEGGSVRVYEAMPM